MCCEVYKEGGSKVFVCLFPKNNLENDLKRHQAFKFETIYKLEMLIVKVPECQDMRRTIREGEAYLKPYLDERKNLQKEAAARGEAPPKFDDAIEWTEQEYVEERSSRESFVPNVHNQDCGLALTVLLFQMLSSSSTFPPLRFTPLRTSRRKL